MKILRNIISIKTNLLTDYCELNANYFNFLNNLKYLHFYLIIKYYFVKFIVIKQTIKYTKYCQIYCNKTKIKYTKYQKVIF